MRIVYIGVSHWHTFLYLDPVLGLPGIDIVGVSDPDRLAAGKYAERLGCPAFAQVPELCDAARPDFAFVLGTHDTMAASCRHLIERGIPFCVEKPAGVDGAEVARLAQLARERGVFAAVPFVMRESRMIEAIRQRAAGDDVHFMSFRFIAGPVSRYLAAGCDWMLDRKVAGGGALLNLGVHWIDFCRVIAPDAGFEVQSASISSLTGDHTAEDHALVVLRGRGGKLTCTIETGYLYPAPPGAFDLRYSIATANRYFIAPDAETLEVIDSRQQREVLKLPTTNVPHYPGFTRGVLQRFARGEPPVADLDDMAATLQLVDAAYTKGRA